MVTMGMTACPFPFVMQSFCLAVKLEVDFGLKARKIREAKCVEVKWNKVESGACYVKYEVIYSKAHQDVTSTMLLDTTLEI